MHDDDEGEEDEEDEDEEGDEEEDERAGNHGYGQRGYRQRRVDSGDAMTDERASTVAKLSPRSSKKGPKGTRLRPSTDGSAPRSLRIEPLLANRRRDRKQRREGGEGEGDGEGDGDGDGNGEGGDANVYGDGGDDSFELQVGPGLVADSGVPLRETLHKVTQKREDMLAQTSDLRRKLRGRAAMRTASADAVISSPTVRAAHGSGATASPLGLNSPSRGPAFVSPAEAEPSHTPNRSTPRADTTTTSTSLPRRRSRAGNQSADSVLHAGRSPASPALSLLMSALPDAGLSLDDPSPASPLPRPAGLGTPFKSKTGLPHPPPSPSLSPLPSRTSPDRTDLSSALSFAARDAEAAITEGKEKARASIAAASALEREHGHEHEHGHGHGHGHEEHHSVGFALTLHEMSLEAFTEEKQAHFTYDLASSLAVRPSQVAINGFKAGSLVVETRITGLKHAAHAEEMAAHVQVDRLTDWLTGSLARSLAHPPTHSPCSR